jgi:hypothetical protein
VAGPTTYEASYHTFHFIRRNRAIRAARVRVRGAPHDTAFAHPLKATEAELDELTLPVYETRAKLPFSA